MGGEVADGEGEQVGRDRLGHGEEQAAVTGLAGGGRHHGGEPLGRQHQRLVANAGPWGVLQGDQTARMDGLALRQHEGLARGGLGTVEPHQPTGGGRGRVADAHPLHRMGALDAQSLPEHGVGGAPREGEGPAIVVGDLVDLEVAGVEIERAAVRAVEHELGFPSEAPGGEVDLPPQVQGLGAALVEVGVAVGVGSHGTSEGAPVYF